jgi:hypothetical protein
MDLDGEQILSVLQPASVGWICEIRPFGDASDCSDPVFIRQRQVLLIGCDAIGPVDLVPVQENHNSVVALEIQLQEADFRDIGDIEGPAEIGGVPVV